ncbi:MAG: two-component regulator propeller domain-containing protein [Bacteroidota bacterium]
MVRISLLLVLWPAIAAAQFVFDTYTIEDGLPHQSVRAIEQDQSGYMWFGTEDGVSRFDGYRFQTYRHVPGDSTTPAAGRVNHIKAAQDGSVWVASQAGVSVYDPSVGRFAQVAGAPGQPGSRCGQISTQVFQDSLGGIWTDTEDAGICHKPAGAQAFEEAHVMHEERTYFPSLVASDQRQWFLNMNAITSGAVCAFDLHTQTCVPGSSRPHLLRWRSPTGRVELRIGPPVVMPSVWMHIWVDGISHGITSRELSGTQQMFLLREERYLWMAEVRGIRLFDTITGQSRLLRTGQELEGLPGRVVRAIFEDRRGDVWVGTDEGVGRLRSATQPPFVRYRAGTSPEGLTDARVNGVVAAQDGSIWIGTQRGLNRLDPKTNTVEGFTRPGEDVHTNAYWSILEEPDGTLLVGTKRNGIHRFDPETGTFSYVPTETAHDRPGSALAVRNLMHDASGRTWAFTSFGAFVRHPGDATFRPLLTPYPELSFLRTEPVSVGYQDSERTLWFGTDNGLCRFDELAGDARCFRPAGPGRIRSSVIWTMTELAATPDTLWVGTIGGGLCRTPLSGGPFQCYDEDDGLPNNNIYGLLPDDSGRLWMSTHRGLARFDPETERFDVFTEEDGLLSNAFDFMAYERAPDGTMYFGGYRGLNRFHPDSVRFSTYDPPVVVSGFAVFGERHPASPDAADTLRLRHDENFFSFDLASLDYTNPRVNVFRYRLLGYDEAWRQTDGWAPTATYTGVPPGEYVFELAGTNRDGVVSTKTASVHVWVEPAYWQTGWFRWGGLALLVGLFGALGWAAYQRRIRAWERQRSEEKEMQRRLSESRQRERERIARDLHDGPVQRLYTVGHELDALEFENGIDRTVQGVRSNVNTVVDELRQVVTTLRPTVVEHLGFEAALDALVRQCSKRYPDIEFTLRTEPASSLLAEPAKYALYRIAEEALSNVIKHAQAGRVAVVLEARDSVIRLMIQDDGIGFKPPERLIELARAGRFGLVGVRERVEQLGGTFRLDARRGSGTEFVVELPR